MTEGGRYVRLWLGSTDFDAFLRVLSSDGVELASNDDSDSASNPRDSYVEIQVPDDGVVIIHASSYEHVFGDAPGTGDFTLRVE